jgi:hypothetical protein
MKEALLMGMGEKRAIMKYRALSERVLNGE